MKPMFADVYCDTINEARSEVLRRKRIPNAEGIITRYEKSSYGGYHVYSVSADLLADELIDPVRPNLFTLDAYR